MYQNGEESKGVQDERLRMISNMIEMVLDNDMSWETLKSVLNDMASNPSKSKQIISILIHELKALHIRFEREVIENDTPSNSIEIDITETEKTEDFGEEVQIIADSDKSEIEEDNEYVGKIFQGNEEFNLDNSKIDETSNEYEEFNLHMNDEDVLENLVNEPEIESTEIQMNEMISEQYDVLENEFYVFIGDKSEKLKRPEKDQNESSSDELKQILQTDKRNFNCHEITHTEMKRFHCQTCSKSFTRLGHLEKHERIHTGEQPFKCNTCKKCFNVSSTLKRHKRIHTGENPFKCKYCKKSFIDSSTLSRHEIIHTGEKPFKCKNCDKCFTQKVTLTTHEKIHVS